MKKFLLCIVLFLICIFKVYSYDLTDTFYYDIKLPNMYVTKIKDGKLKNTATFLLHRSNSDFVYCIDPFTSEIDGTYEGYIGYNSQFGLSKEQVNRMNLLAYYGYGYNNHTDLKWYGITQYLIWDTLGLDDIYYTDKYYGDRITQYVDEIGELNNLVNNHFITPSFSNSINTYSIKKEYVLTDTNNVLSEYDIDYSGDLNIKKDGNNLIVSSDNSGSYTIRLVKKSKVTNDYILYSNSSSQNMFYPGKYDDVYASFNVNFISGTIEINKQDRETGVKQGQATFEDARYGLYENDNLIKEVSLDEEGYGLFTDLPLSNYYIKEITPSRGYMLDDTKYEVNLTTNNNNQDVIVYEDIIKNKYKIVKKYGNEITNTYYLESDVSFELYDSLNNLIDTYITDENGEINLLLPYGEYTLKQINGKDNYTFSDPISIKVDEIDNLKEIEVNDLEIIKKGNLQIKKIGSDGVLLDGVKFKVYAKEDIVSLTGDIYYKAGDLVSEVIVKNGYAYVNDLYYGSYYLVETDGVSGYIMNSDKINVTIDNDISNIEVVNEKYNIPNTGKNDINYQKLLSNIFIIIGIIGLYEIKNRFNFIK